MTYDTNRNMVNHPPDQKTQRAMERVRRDFHVAAITVDYVVPDGREKSLAFTKLEEALMWSMAALARDDFDRKRGEGVNELSGHATSGSGVNRS